MNLYKAHGYEDRDDYLKSLADEYGVPIQIVNVMADILGPEEDFDGLVISLQDAERYHGL